MSSLCRTSQLSGILVNNLFIGNCYFIMNVNSLHICPILVSPYNLVTVTPRNSLTSQNENAVFTCESEGGPGNTFEWYHGNQLLSNETTPLLEITMVTPSDAGDYNCTVTNAAGSGSDVATLTGESL